MAFSLSASPSLSKQQGKGVEVNMRVNRALRATHSRRQVNRFIDDRRLKVNGVICLTGEDRLMSGDVVKLDNIKQVWEEQDLPPHLYIKFHKPAGVITTTDRRVPNNILDAFENAQQSQPQNNNNNTNATTTLYQQQQQQQKQRRRVYPIGRLDADSVGLILLTSDGRIVNPLLRVNANKTKEYYVRTSPPATNSNILDLRNGITITTLARRNGMDGIPVTAKTLPCLVERVTVDIVSTTTENNDGDDTSEGQSQSSLLRFVISEGRNRQIRKMCAKLGLVVTYLHRSKFAGITTNGIENVGSCQHLTDDELMLIGAKTKEELRTPEERLQRKLKKLNNKRKKKKNHNGGKLRS